MTTISSCLSSGCQQVLDFTNRGGCDGHHARQFGRQRCVPVGLVGMNEQKSCLGLTSRKGTLMAVTTSPPTATEWADAFAQASNTDPEIQAHGKYFTCSYLLDMAERTFVVEVSRGKVVNVAIDPGPLDVAYQFAHTRERRYLAELRRSRACADVPRHLGRQLPARHETRG